MECYHIHEIASESSDRTSLVQRDPHMKEVTEYVSTSIEAIAMDYR